jgi:DNA recombination protein RmuC
MENAIFVVLGAALGFAVGWLARPSKQRSGDAGNELAAANARVEELRTNLEQFELERKQRVETENEMIRRLEPLRTRLEQMQNAVEKIEQDRIEQYSTLQEQMRQAQAINQKLGDTTKSLASALSDKQIRGSWGEISLRRLLEHAGLLPHVDFYEQYSSENEDGNAIRIDAAVRLPDGKYVAIDAKVPLSNLQRAVDISELGDDSQLQKRKEFLKAHAKDVRSRVDEISKKDYYSGLPDSPEFTVMFIPSESILSLTLEADPELLNYAFEKKVAVVSPVSFFTSMKTIHYSWRQTAAETTIRQLMDAGVKLYKSLRVMAEHASSVGQNLNKSVLAYNNFVSSIERNLLSSMRELDKTSKGALNSGKLIPEIPELSETTTQFVKPEVLESEQKERLKD